MSLVIGEAWWLFALGIGVGLVAAWASRRVVASMLFGIEPADPVSTAAAGVVLTMMALIAVSVPARRASRVDPMQALRAD